MRILVEQAGESSIEHCHRHSSEPYDALEYQDHFKLVINYYGGPSDSKPVLGLNKLSLIYYIVGLSDDMKQAIGMEWKFRISSAQSQTCSPAG